MTDSILNTTKKLLGIAEENTEFDLDIILDINSVFTILTQLGVGSSDGFFITDSSAAWTDFIPEGKLMEAVKSYMGCKVKMLFDPPASSVAMQALGNMCDEFEWRLNVLCDEDEFLSF